MRAAGRLQDRWRSRSSFGLPYCTRAGLISRVQVVLTPDHPCGPGWAGLTGLLTGYKLAPRLLFRHLFPVCQVSACTALHVPGGKAPWHGRNRISWEIPRLPDDPTGWDQPSACISGNIVSEHRSPKEQLLHSPPTATV